MKGGYKIIDFGGVNLTNSATVIAGVYDALEENTKPVMLEGLKVSNTEYSAQFVNVAASGGNFLMTFIVNASATTLNMVQVMVTSADAVTATAVALEAA